MYSFWKNSTSKRVNPVEFFSPQPQGNAPYFFLSSALHFFTVFQGFFLEYWNTRILYFLFQVTFG